MRRLLFLAAMLTLLVPAVAAACTCLHWPTPQEDYDWADTVFEGRVLSTWVDGHYRFADVLVYRYWKGSPPAVLRLATEPDPGMCGVWLEAGHTFLIYGYDALELDADVYTHGCTRSGLTSMMTDDHAYLDTLPVVVSEETGTWGDIKAVYR